MGNNTVVDKSMAFAVRIVRLYQFLSGERKEYVLSKQLLRCGTSIGANVTEALDGISRRDFLNKMYIALKECSESSYWIELLHRTGYLDDAQYRSIWVDCNELKHILSSITKTTKDSMRMRGSD